VAVPVATFTSSVTGTGTLTPGVPSHQVNDILVCAVTTEDNTATLTPPAGWTQITATQLNTTGIKTVAWWRRVGVGETVANPAITKSTGSGAGVATVIRIRGAQTTGNPWNTPPIGQANASSTTVSCGGALAAATDQALIVMIVGNSTDTNSAQTSAYRAVTDPVQASWTEVDDTQTNTASGAGQGIGSAPKTGAGSTGNLNATLATASVSVGIAFEIAPTILVNVLRRLPYKMNGMVQVQRDLPYKVRLFVQTQRDLVYKITQTVGVVRQTPYTVLSLVGLSRNLLWTIKTLVGVTRNLPWTIFKIVGQTTRLPYTIRKFVSVARTLPSKVLSASPITVVGTTTTWQSGPNGNLRPDFPAASQTNDLGLLFVAVRTDNAPPASILPTPNNWKLLHTSARGTEGRVWLFTKPYQGDTAPFVTISGATGSGPGLAAMIVLRGHDPVVGVGDIIVNTGTAQAQQTPAITTRIPNVFLTRFVASALAGATAAYAWDTAQEQVDLVLGGNDGTKGTISIATENAPAAGDVPARAATYSGSAPYVALTVGVNPAGTGVFVQTLRRLPYIVRKAISVQRRTPYAVKALVAAPRRLVYAVRGLASAQRRLPYMVKGLAGLQRRMPYRVMGLVGTVRNLPTTVRGLAAVARTLAYKIITWKIDTDLVIRPRVRVETDPTQVEIGTLPDQVHVSTEIPQVGVEPVVAQVGIELVDRPVVAIEDQHPVVRVGKSGYAVRVGTPNPVVKVKENN